MARNSDHRVQQGASSQNQSRENPTVATPRSAADARAADARAADAEMLEGRELDSVATSTSVAARRFWVAAIAILVVGALLRLWHLGDAPFSHDEAIHAQFSLHFGDYSYDPVYHGPLLYHLTAACFRVFGDSDWSARLVPALLGIGLLGLVLGTRRWLRGGALCAALLLVLSPCISAYSRRLIHDALVLVLTLGAVLCFQIARETMRRSLAGRASRIGLVVLCALLLATKANAWFIIAMLLGFWVVQVVRAWVENGRGENGRRENAWERWLPRAAFLIVALSSCRVRYTPLAPIAGAVSPGDANGMISEKAFTLLCVAAVLLVMEWLRRAPPEKPMPIGAASDLESRGWDWVAPLLSLVVGFLVFAFLYGHGVSWWRAPGEIGSHLWTEVLGPKSALPKMKAYWGGQQLKPRLPGPRDYYIVLMLMYELPIVLAALGGIWRASRHRAPFTDLLLWWAFTSFALYSVANEKVPWLLVHIMLPLSLLAGDWLWHLARELWPRMSTHGARQDAATQLSTDSVSTSAARKNLAKTVAVAETVAVAKTVAVKGTASKSATAKKKSEHKAARESAKDVLAREREESRRASRLAWRRGAFVASCALGALFLARGVVATSFGRSGDNHEPLFYANSTETFHESLLAALGRTRGQAGALWVAQGNEWPNVWYLRPGAPLVGSSSAAFSILPQASGIDMARPNALRVAQSPTPDEWKTLLTANEISLAQWQEMQRHVNGWPGETVDFIIWPRASWNALRPDNFARWWMFRQANETNGILSEWSHNQVVVSTAAH